MSRFKGLDMVNRVPEELWLEVCNRRQWPKASQRKRNQEDKVIEEALQIAEERREVRGKGEGNDILNWMQSSRE